MFWIHLIVLKFGLILKITTRSYQCRQSLGRLLLRNRTILLVKFPLVEDLNERRGWDKTKAANQTGEKGEIPYPGAEPQQPAQQAEAYRENLISSSYCCASVAQGTLLAVPLDKAKALNYRGAGL